MAGARQYDELEVWQLAAQLRRRVQALTAADWPARDVTLRDQLMAAAASAPSNIAEGFGHFNPRQFARFTRIARGSLVETRNHLDDAAERGLISPADAAELRTLTSRAIGATTAFLRYLESCDGKTPTRRPPEP